jgi:hypothetical protein
MVPEIDSPEMIKKIISNEREHTRIPRLNPKQKAFLVTV